MTTSTRRYLVQIQVADGFTERDSFDASADIVTALEDFGFKGAKVLGTATIKSDGKDGPIAELYEG